jgi:protein TonB
MQYSFGGPPAPAFRPNRSGGSTGAINFALGPIARNSLGAPPRDPTGNDLDSQVRGAHVGEDWLAELHAWWDRHSFYPPQAAANGEDGPVQVRLQVDRSGQVESVELLQRSGSRWLDLGAQAVFRGQKLPPFPVNTPEPKAELDLTINYILIRR